MFQYIIHGNCEIIIVIEDFPYQLDIGIKGIGIDMKDKPDMQMIFKLVKHI